MAAWAVCVIKEIMSGDKVGTAEAPKVALAVVEGSDIPPAVEVSQRVLDEPSALDGVSSAKSGACKLL